MAGQSLVAQTQSWHLVGGRARGANVPTFANSAISGTILTQNSQKIFLGGGRNGPKMAPKSHGGAPKIPKNPPKVEKMAKTAPQSPT